MEVRALALGSVLDSRLAYAVVGARTRGGWIFVRHRDRSTWEMPGGRREPGETIQRTAERELYEESGASPFELHPVCEYSVVRDGDLSFGRLYHAEVSSLGDLPGFEIVEVAIQEHQPSPLTYPAIQPVLMERLEAFLSGGGGT